MDHAEDQPPSPPRNEVSANTNRFPATSLYVGDLDLNVSETQLYDLFNKLAHVVSVKVCRDRESGRSLGYGYVNYGNNTDEHLLLELLAIVMEVGPFGIIIVACITSKLVEEKE